MAIRTANNQSLTEITTLPSAVTIGSLVLLATETASSSATISFTSGIDSTYDEYIFKFYNIHPATDNDTFGFNLSVDTGSNYNVTKTTTFFRAEHKEDGTDASLSYRTANDLAQGTGFQQFTLGSGDDANMSLSGFLTIYNPSSTTFVKHFVATTNVRHKATPYYCINAFVAGYGNTTSAVDAIQFKMSGDAIDAGIIKMYGVT